MLIELRVPRDLGRDEVLAMATEALQPLGLRIDTNYAPVTVKPSGEGAQRLGEDDVAVVIRGTVEIDQQEMLAQHARVLRVWADTPISPMESEPDPPQNMDFD